MKNTEKGISLEFDSEGNIKKVKMKDTTKRLRIFLIAFAGTVLAVLDREILIRMDISNSIREPVLHLTVFLSSFLISYFLNRHFFKNSISNFILNLTSNFVLIYFIYGLAAAFVLARAMSRWPR